MPFAGTNGSKIAEAYRDCRPEPMWQDTIDHRPRAQAGGVDLGEKSLLLLLPRRPRPRAGGAVGLELAPRGQGGA